MSTTIELFAGPGGWGEGARSLGLEPVGIENDDDAIATARAAGHVRLHGDVSAVDPYAIAAQYGTAGLHGAEIEGLIGSPPCPGWSISNRNATGRGDSGEIIATIAKVDTLPRLELALRLLRPRVRDLRTLLALEPLRWALALEPRWVALEQVPPVLPLWQACAAILRARGYAVATGLVHAEQYGVPQTRRRAVLLARAGSPVAFPAPTHSRYHPRDPQRLDPGVLPWVSMASALGWGMTHRPYPTVAVGTGGGGGTDPAALGGSGARRTVHAERDAGRWQPWTDTRPATTVQGDSRIWPPGHKVNGVDRARYGDEAANARYGDRAGTGAIRVTETEAGILQGFRPDYPWQGGRGSRFQQIGNAVPPPLAAALLGAVAGRDERRPS